jgi:hypothetical protein
MVTRVYAEAMYKSILWQVVREDFPSRECSVIAKGLSQSAARTMAERVQQSIDETSRINATRWVNSDERS